MTTVTRPAIEFKIRLHRPHPGQEAVRRSQAKRKIIRAGRRGGKTDTAATMSVDAFLASRRVLYAAPTSEQLDAYWRTIKQSLMEPIEAGLYYKNETLHTIERPNTENRIRAKTAWNADTLRGDSADLLILDEWQLMDEEAWGQVGAPLLLDNNGDALFIYTPPSLASRSVSKARDPFHAAKMYKAAQADKTGRWQAFHWTSMENPHVSRQALADITKDISSLAYRQEIMAEDTDEVPGALWTRKIIEAARASTAPDLVRVVIGVDPPGGSTECGIIVTGRGADGHLYVLRDASLKATPDKWASVVLECYQEYKADRIVGEQNYGGEMVEATIRQAAQARGVQVSYKAVQATRGKAIRAEPIVAQYEQGRIHHVGTLPTLEDELVTWIPGISANSPNRLDANVWALSELSTGRSWRAI